MQRGVISLTRKELESMHALIESELLEHPNLLQKITPTDAVDNLIELSSEEAELLLDGLAAPTQQDSPDLRSGRLKLQSFLQSL